MTGGVVDDFGDPDRSARATFLQRVAHLFPAVIVIDTVLFVLIQAGALPRWLSMATLAPILLVLVIGQMHVLFARICLPCMEQVREDASVRVQSNRRWVRTTLRIYHLTDGWKFFLVVAGPMIVAGLLVRWLAGETLEDWEWGWTIQVPAHVWLMASFGSMWRHHKYLPWCPWCRRWDEGGEHEPSPDPVDNGTKVA